MMRNKILIALCALIVITPIAKAQTVANGNTNTWFLLLNRFYMSDKITVTNELHERTGDFLSDQATFIARPSIDYLLNDNTEFSVGYSYIRSSPYSPYTLPISTNEHNIWEQVLLKFNTGKVQIQNRIRFEHRFVDNVQYSPAEKDFIINGSNFKNRFRFRFNLSFDVFKVNKGKHTIFVNVFDEAWINQSDNLMPNSFGRNWIYTGLGYKFNKDFNIQLAHLHQYERVGNNTFISSSIIQLSVFKNFKLYKHQ